MTVIARWSRGDLEEYNNVQERKALLWWSRGDLEEYNNWIASLSSQWSLSGGEAVAI